MVFPSFEGPSKGSSTTFKLLPLDGHLSFSSFLKAYFFSYCEFGSTASTSKATIEGTSMVVIVV
jgi:hypothetical protein